MGQFEYVSLNATCFCRTQGGKALLTLSIGETRGSGANFESERSSTVLSVRVETQKNQQDEEDEGGTLLMDVTQLHQLQISSSIHQNGKLLGMLSPEGHKKRKKSTVKPAVCIRNQGN